MAAARTQLGTMTVILIGEHVTYRESLRIALQTLTTFEVIGEASAAHEAIPLIEERSPGLAVIDSDLQDSTGIALVRELMRRRSGTRTLLLGQTAHPFFVRDAIRSGADGFVLKRQPLEEIIAAMRTVAAGNRYISPESEERLREGASQVQPLSSLSSREREVLLLLTKGLSSKEIGKLLFVSSKTVDAHRLHINRKLGVRSPAGLAHLVATEGLLSV